MPDSIINAAIRAARTFAQTFVGVYLAGYAGASLAGLADLTLLDTAAAAGIVAVLSLVQNLLEESSSWTYRRG